MAAITLEKIEKSFGAQKILKELSLSINEGEFVVLVGPSGCGKSTTLRMIAGLEELSRGTISIGGNIVNDVDTRERDIAMVFQSYALYPHLNVYDNMAFGLKLRGVANAEIKSRVEGVAKTLDIMQLLDRKPKALSGGQRQRVAMGRAIVRNPKVFLFDEPLSNLDAQLRSRMRVEIKRLMRELKATAVYVTHDQTEAMTMADRIVILNQGEVMQIGTPTEVYDRPANAFVAQFIGNPSMNLLEIEQTQGFAKLSETVKLVLPQTKSARFLLGLRPQDFRLGTELAMPISGHVNVAEFLGAETLLELQVGSHVLQALVGGNQKQLEHQTTTVSIDPSRLHFFDSATKERLS